MYKQKMKKVLLFSLIASMFMFGCSDDDNGNGGGTPEPTDNLAVTTVKKENQSLAIKFSGTNCPPCGGWGWLMASEIKDGVDAAGGFMTVYGQNFVAELFIIPEATTLQDAWGATGYPHFGANGSVTTVDRSSGVNTAAEKQEIYDRVNTHMDAEVVANTGLNYKIEGDEIKLKYKTTAWSAINAPYLAIYVFEDKVKGNQAGHSEGPNALHKNVFRGEFTAGEGYGSPIEGLAVGTDVSGEMTIDMESDWDADNIGIYAVIYDKEIGGYSFVNLAKGNKVD